MVTCSKCGSSANPFYVTLPTICKPCHLAYQRAYYAANREKYVTRDRQRNQLNRDRVLARKYVENAIKAGRMTPKPCSVCGKKAEAHHPDYARPAHVIWLCRPHHKDVHRKPA